MINVGDYFFEIYFPNLEILFKNISLITNDFNNICENIFQPKQDEKEQYKRQEEHTQNKQSAYQRLTEIYQSDEPDFILDLAFVWKQLKDKTGIENYNLDEMYLAYYKLLLKG